VRDSPIEDAIRRRRSIRELHGPPLSSDEVESLVWLALTAPAPHHTQPWRFVEVSQERRATLAVGMGQEWQRDLQHDGVPLAQQERALARSKGQIEDAPTLLLGCLVTDGLNEYQDDRRRQAEWALATHSFGAALQNVLIVASARGLGAYWISAPLYAPEAVRAALDLEQAWQPQAFVALGRPDTEYTPFERPTPDLGVHFVRR